jgi:hypothetical protein
MITMSLAFVRSVDRVLSVEVTFDFCHLRICSEEGQCRSMSRARRRLAVGSRESISTEL